MKIWAGLQKEGDREGLIKGVDTRHYAQDCCPAADQTVQVAVQANLLQDTARDDDEEGPTVKGLVGVSFASGC
jgi:hypothetical protein